MTGRLFITIITAAAGGIAATGVAAQDAAPQVVMSLSPAPAPLSLSRLTVAGSAGRYDRLIAARAGAALKLSASIGPANAPARKIVQSAISVKTGTVDGARAVETLEPGRWTDVIDESRTFDLPVTADSEAGLKAIAACNALAPVTQSAARTTAIDVTILWRVTTGRFTFKWTNYDRVGPSADILNNADFYGDRESSDVEIVGSIGVDCAPLPATGPLAKIKHAAVANVATAKFTVAKPATAVDPDTRAHAANDKPQCTGGIGRQLGPARLDGFACLCPGNTVRIETGDNAFTCQRRMARK